MGVVLVFADNFSVLLKMIHKVKVYIMFLA
jgi:hypothetical protein